MAVYYYLMASLPFLRFDHKPDLPYEDFAHLCLPWLTTRDKAQFYLARTDIEDVPFARIRNKTLRQWYVFEHSLRNALVKLRSETLGVLQEAYLRKEPAVDPSVTGSVRRKVEEVNPYRAEVNLLRLRWDFVTDCETGHYFDLTALILYSLKLQILERLSTFDTEKGRKVLEGIYKQSFYGDQG